ncbi:unnamed protein product [Oikopleura dioica]|uniref:Uncharacterized protein n=1 Tax=Oikopleura dioica TaxID=34765 RepID=E4WS01_OIKDI|nr:unnamed protein product [Oikopleura dioica]
MNILEMNNAYGSFAIGYFGFYLTHMAVTNNFAGFQSQTQRIRQMENKNYSLVEKIIIHPECSEIELNFFNGESRLFHESDLEVAEDYTPPADFYLSTLSTRSKTHYDLQVRLNEEFDLHETEKATSSSYLSSIAGFLAQRMNIMKQNFIYLRDDSSGEYFRVPLQIPMISKAHFNIHKDLPIIHDLTKALYMKSKKINNNSFLEMMQISQKKFQFRYVICFYQQTNTLIWTKILGDPKNKKNYWNWRIHGFLHFIWRSKTYLLFPSGLLYIYLNDNKVESE